MPICWWANAPRRGAGNYAGSGRCAFTRHCWFALTGAACEATSTARRSGWAGEWRRRPAAAGAENPQHGIRSYLAVAGGIDVLKF
ncbi:hypothetical protein ACL655_09440 [Klebsiella quasipneumoniae subsp. similipneumoniae]